MDYCVATNQIGHYASGAGTNEWPADPLQVDVNATTPLDINITGFSGFDPLDISVRNVECVTLDADTINCASLTVDGESLPVDLTAIIDATQNQTGTSGETTFTGTVQMDDLEVHGILSVDTISAFSTSVSVVSPVIASDTVTINSQLTVQNTTATGNTTLMNLLASNQTSGETTLNIGRSETTNNCGQIKHVYTGSGSANNYMQLNVYGSSGPQVYSTYTNIPNVLQVQNVQVNPRSIGTLRSLSGAGPYNWDLSDVTNIRKIVVSLSDMVMAAGATNTPFLTVGQGSTFYPTNIPTSHVGANWGNNGGATISFQNEGIYLWNQATLPSPSTNYRISGTIEFTYAGNWTGSQQCWTVSGVFGTPDTGPGPYWVIIAGSIRLNATYPTLSGIQLRKNSTNFGSGYANVLYY